MKASVNSTLLIVCIISVVASLTFATTLTVAFLSHDYSSNHLVTAASFSVLNYIGPILIIRKHKVGLFFNLLTSSLTFLYSTPDNQYVISLVLLSVVTIILYLLPLSKDDRNNMVWGFDLIRGKRFYLFAFLSIALIIFLCNTCKHTHSTIDVLDSSTTDSSLLYNTTVDPIDIFSPNITFKQLTLIEKQLPADSLKQYQLCIIAMKHILLNELMLEAHSSDNLRNIIRIYRGYFASQQQEILDWYKQLPPEHQDVWNHCPKVNNLSEFKETLSSKINN